MYTEIYLNDGRSIRTLKRIEDIDRYPDAVIEFYNRLGSLLFSAKGDTYNDNKWDGTHEGSPLPIGTYYYIINLNNNSDLQSGAITIIR